MILDKAKALVAAIVGFGASYAAIKFGFNIPEDAQVYAAATISGLLTGFFTWLVPNTPSA